MTSRTAIAGMLRTDARRLARDRFLLGMTAYIASLAVVARWALPWIGRELMARIGFDLSPYRTLIVSHIVVQTAPLAGGLIGGLLLLEARESRFIRAQMVTPAPLTSYVAVLGSCCVAVAASLTVLQGLVIGTGVAQAGVPRAPGLVGAALAGAPASLFLALFVGTVAKSKTEAFAYLKIAGTLPLLPTASFFLAEPWQWLAALYPPYFASKAYWLAADGQVWWPWALAGLAWSTVWLAGLTTLFLRAVRRP